MKLPFKPVKTELTMTQFISQLKRKRKMRQVGRGAFARVYGTKTGKTVVKVGLLYDDDGNVAYLHYLKAVSSHKNNPFFPKVKSIRVFKTKDKYGDDEIYMAVEMERLAPLKEQQSNAADMIDDIVCYKDQLSVMSLFVACKKTMANLKQVHDVITPFRHIRSRFRVDIHDGNVMVRKNGQLVLTDPLA